MFAHKAIEAALGAGHTAPGREALFGSIGVDPNAPIDPKHMISDHTFFSLFERLATECDEGRAVAVRVGASMRCDDYGAFGLAFKSARNLLGSYRRVERFGKVVTTIANFRVVEDQGTVFVEVIPGEGRRLGLTMTNELAIAAATSLSREVASRSFTPKCVHFTHAPPHSVAEQAAHFKCPVNFHSARDAIEVELRALTQPNRLGDAGISAFFDAHLDRELDALGEPTSLARLVFDQISDALSEGVPTLTYVAGRLGMSSRTLQRRLAEAELAYQDLVADARQTLAEQLLAKTDYALAEIAFLTGFSDQSTFTRAFKRRNGQTPANFRRKSAAVQ